MHTKLRTSSEWFQEAARCYLERHQGCAWCGGSHRVFRICRENQVVYYCNGCDSRAEHDESANQFLWVPGEEQDTTRAQPTMYQI
jgi:hypothetical protein